ncbi:MAG: hypothetical protein QG653_475 [Patescibacteria group bacterium]|nr:hypothetical protein [Patescibacteria group bacterium]
MPWPTLVGAQEPKFPIGYLVIADIPNPAPKIEGEKEYLLIQRRRYICPQGEEKKQWVYDGILYALNEKGLRISTGASCVLESKISCLVGHSTI